MSLSSESAPFTQTYQLIASHALRGEYDSDWRLKAACDLIAGRFFNFVLCDEGGRSREVKFPSGETHNITYVARVDITDFDEAEVPVMREYWLLSDGDVLYWECATNQQPIVERKSADILSEVLTLTSE